MLASKDINQPPGFSSPEIASPELHQSDLTGTAKRKQEIWRVAEKGPRPSPIPMSSPETLLSPGTLLSPDTLLSPGTFDSTLLSPAILSSSVNLPIDHFEIELSSTTESLLGASAEPPLKFVFSWRKLWKFTGPVSCTSSNLPLLSSFARAGMADVLSLS
jgi:hypothetical protein